MKNIPFFSVVIPVYNISNIFGVTLESLVNQSFKDFEVIIVDDFSVDFDELQTVIKKYEALLRIFFIRHSSNRNGAAARNTAIASSKGRFIAFLDSDDTWNVEKLEVMKQVIENNKSAEDTIFYSKTAIVHDSKIVAQLPLDGIRENESAGDYLFCRLGFMQTSSIVCSRIIAVLIKFDERYGRHQDWDFCIRASAFGFKFHFVNRVLTNYFVQSDSLHHEKIRLRGFNPKFCEFWIEKMKKHLSIHAVAGYNFYVLAPVYSSNGYIAKSVVIRIMAACQFNKVMWRRVLIKIYMKFVKKINSFIFAKTS